MPVSLCVNAYILFYVGNQHYDSWLLCFSQGVEPGGVSVYSPGRKADIPGISYYGRRNVSGYGDRALYDHDYCLSFVPQGFTRKTFSELFRGIHHAV